MPVVKKSALVPYTPEQMFLLVNDVESYPQFLPWCSASRVLSEEGDEIRALVKLSHGKLRKTFTTCNRVQRGKMIEIRLGEGPFRLLEGFWRFDHTTAGRCRVSLDLEYEFSSRLLRIVLGPVFSQIANTLVAAFCQRAREIYVES